MEPQKTDHMPIISVLEIEPKRTMHAEKYNYKMTDWELAINLVEIQETEDFTSIEVCLNQINKLDTAIKDAIKDHIQVAKPSPYAKRWWMKELANLKRDKEHLARRSYKRRVMNDDHIHKEFRRAWNNYSKMIRKTKDEHWIEWLETLDEEGCGQQTRWYQEQQQMGDKAGYPHYKSETL